jgi:hypothetical protein
MGRDDTASVSALPIPDFVLDKWVEEQKAPKEIPLPCGPQDAQLHNDDQPPCGDGTAADGQPVVIRTKIRTAVEQDPTRP